jgi:pSer/pThr/pTyr-binding forkhead associated (FHA) protein
MGDDISAVEGANRPRYAVVVQNGRGEQVAIPLEKDKTKFGRYPVPSNDVCLAEPVGYRTEVARYHFDIRWDAAASAHVAVDYGQKHPIRVNGVPLINAQRRLKVGDVIEIGRFKIAYIGGDNDGPPTGTAT